jgi:hypothetical protein
MVEIIFLKRSSADLLATLIAPPAANIYFFLG